MLLNKKFLFLICLLFFIAFLFICSSVNATTYDLSDYSNRVNSDYPWCIVYNIDNDNIYLIVGSRLWLGIESNYNWTSSGRNTEFYMAMGSISVYNFNKENSTFVFSQSYGAQQFSCGNNLEFVACNKDVIRPTSSTTTTVVFQATPLTSTVNLRSRPRTGDSGGSSSSIDDPNGGGGNTINDNESTYNPGANWFDNIWSALSSIPSKIQDMATMVSNFFSNFWTSFTGGLSNFGTTIGNFFSSLGTNIGGFFNVLWTNISNSGFITNISNIWNGFVDLLQYINPLSDRFFLKIAFTLSEQQEVIHNQKDAEYQLILQNKFPAVSILINQFQALQNSQNNVSNTKSFSKNSAIENSPLNLDISGFSYNSGVISVSTDGFDLTTILEAYEPYRVVIRNGLKLVGYAMGIVYLVKHFLNYGATSAVSVIDKSKGE